jgi:hypothetical protein
MNPIRQVCSLRLREPEEAADIYLMNIDRAIALVDELHAAAERRLALFDLERLEELRVLLQGL